MNSTKKVDLIIVTDGTGSMGSFLSSLSDSLKQIIQIMDITNIFRRIAVMVYRDYSEDNVIETSNWVDKFDLIFSFVDDLYPDGGGDQPEAAKTAAHRLLQMVSTDTHTIVLWYTDEAPHYHTYRSSNYYKEEQELKSQGNTFDWVEICKQLSGKNITIYPITNSSLFAISSFYVLLSTMTGGQTIYLRKVESKVITKVTIKLLLGLMGHDYQLSEDEALLLAYQDFDSSVILNEIDHGNYLPSKYDFPGRNMPMTPICLKPHPALKSDLKHLIDLFKNDTNYQNKIYVLFESLLREDCILSLTYNNIFAIFWRLICRNYQDPRREKLKTQLGDTLKRLSDKNEDDHKIVSEWISNSYNQTEEANEIIVNKAKSKVPAFVLETTKYYLPQEILEISRSSNSYAFSIVVDLMSHLRIIDKEEELPKTLDDVDNKGRQLPIKYIPLSLPDRYLFSILPHLMAPGCIFSLRPSVIIAAIAYMVNHVVLKERAERYLVSVKGKWFDVSYPENYTRGFINLMLQVPKFLTEPELEFFQLYQKVSGLSINGDTELDVQIIAVPRKTIYYDYKKKCEYCYDMRSFTLMTRDRLGKLKCGLCWSDPSYLRSEPLDDNRSYYVECATCLRRYAVVNIDLLNVTPKCHGCRKDTILPSVKCIKCRMKYVDPANLYNDYFTCAQCRNGEMVLDNLKIPLREIYLENSSVIIPYLGFKINSDVGIFGKLSLYSLRDHIKKVPQLNIPNIISLTIKKKEIVNSIDVLTQIINWIQSGTSEKVSCMFCFNEFFRSSIHTVCGRKACKSVACSSCLRTWYGRNKVGDLLHINALTCPFCKQCPSYAVLSTYNRQVCAMIQANKNFDLDWWYAWCLSCFKPQKVVEKECSTDPPQLDEKFICDECQNLVSITDSKKCPNINCQITIIKDGGCNHINCTACKKHFCWICADVAYDTPEETYNHLYKTHGGAFGVGDDD